MTYHIIFDAEYRADAAIANRYRAMEQLDPIAPDDLGTDGNWAALEIVTLSWLILDELTDGTLVPLRIETSGQPECGEGDIVRQFFTDIARIGDKVTLVSWGGGPIDIRRLMLAAMAHGIALPPALRGLGRPWDRRGMPHIDLMLGICDNAKRLHMAQIAARLDVPAKLVCRPEATFSLMVAGKWSQVKAVCEGDVITTALLYFRHRHLLGDGPQPMMQDVQLCRHVERNLAYRPIMAKIAAWGRARELDIFAHEAERMATLRPDLV